MTKNLFNSLSKLLAKNDANKVINATAPENNTMKIDEEENWYNQKIEKLSVKKRIPTVLKYNRKGIKFIN